MATPSSILAWKIPWTEEPGGLQSTGLQRVGQELATEHADVHSSLPISLFISFFEHLNLPVGIFPGTKHLITFSKVVVFSFGDEEIALS